MTVSYVNFEVQVHGLALDSPEEVEQLRQAVERAVMAVHPKAVSESDVEVTISETAGSPTIR